MYIWSWTNNHSIQDEKDPFFILVMFVLEQEKLDPTWIPLCCLFISIKLIMNQKEKYYCPCEFLQPLLIPRSYFQWEKKSSSNSHWLFWKKLILNYIHNVDFLHLVCNICLSHKTKSYTSHIYKVLHITQIMPWTQFNFIKNSWHLLI